MSEIPRLVGMIHLLPLPGAPGFGGSIREVIDTALEDSRALVDAGFPALLVENFGDVPYPAEHSDPETVAGMTLAVDAVAEATGVPIGVNVLRNDAVSALAIAHVTGARFIRVNVLTGVMYTDQGPVVGPADRLLRRRAALGAEVEIWADVLVKHATAPPGLDIRRATEDTVGRGLADAVIVSGSGTGAEPDLEEAAAARQAMPKGMRLVIGSGANPANLAELTAVGDTVIVGSSLKVDGVATSRVDPARAQAMADAAAAAGLI